MQDLRLGIRSLLATPIVTLVATLSLALGIGANTAIFSLLDAVVLRSLPVAAPQRLALVSTASARTLQLPFSYATFDQIRRHGEAFDGVLAYGCCTQETVKVGNTSYTVTTQAASGDFFTTLGVPALVGRVLAVTDDLPGGGPEGLPVVISDDLWRRQFGRGAGVIGTHITIGRLPVTVVGVTPPGFHGVEVGQKIDVTFPLSALRQPVGPFDDDTGLLNIMLRIKPGQTIDTAAAALRSVQPQIRAGALPKQSFLQAAFLKDPLVLRPAGTGISSLRERFQQPLLVMFIVVALVLLVACANIANLQLARGIGRARELSIRLALGASRWRVARQLLAESGVLAAAGAGLGLTFGVWASRTLAAQLSTAATPVALDLALNGRVLAFTTAAMVAATVLVAVVPALRFTRAAPMGVLREHEPGAAGGGVSSGLVAAQVAVSLILVVAAGLLIRTFERLAHVELGFDRDRALIVSVSAPTVPGIDRKALYQRLVEAVARVPGVARAGGSLNPPIIGTLGGDVVVTAAGTAPRPDTEAVSQYVDITPGWLGAYGTAVRAGRDFDEHDTTAAPPVILVNEALARRFFPEKDVVGLPVSLTVRLPTYGDIPLGTRTIAGVVADSVYRSIREPRRPTIYAPLGQREGPFLWTYFYIAARPAAGAPGLLTRRVTEAMDAVNPDLTIAARPLAQVVDESLAQDRLVARLSGFFGALALLLAALGLYGVTSYVVARRRRELGIRLALGALPAGIVRLVLGRVTVLVATGVVAGGFISLWLATLVSSLLYQVDPHDPVTLGGAVAVLAAVGGLAGFLPAYRASRIDPAVVLRES